jgi:hypothetical protein
MIATRIFSDLDIWYISSYISPEIAILQIAIAVAAAAIGFFDQLVVQMGYGMSWQPQSKD